MAVFILKAKHGTCYVPPPCTGTFPDVPCSSNFAPWIEQLAAEGITGGCGSGNYCPLASVRRDQMAVFMLKGKYGPNLTPPPCTGDLRRRRVPVHLRRLDRAARGRGDHDRLRRSQLLPDATTSFAARWQPSWSRRSACRSLRRAGDLRGGPEPPFFVSPEIARWRGKGRRNPRCSSDSDWPLPCSPPPPWAANTYTVTSTADSGAGTLRQAITDANANPGADTIAFNITGSGVHTIVLASGLPVVTSPVTIDGYTQSGSSANTQPVGQGLNTVLQIEINGLAVLGPCLRLDAGRHDREGPRHQPLRPIDRARRLPGLEHAHRGQLPRLGSGGHAALHQRVHQPGERSRPDRRRGSAARRRPRAT